MLLYNYYYLIYKLKMDDKMWIVAESESEKDLLDNIYNYTKDDIEEYYIIKKQYSYSSLKKILKQKFKRFQNFEYNNNCETLYIIN